MAAHLIRRADCGGTFYLVDGELTRSLKTKVKRYAEALLRQYTDGKYNLHAAPTVGAYYAIWIERKVEPLFRRSKIRDYKQAFKKHILPRFEHTSLIEIKTGDLAEFQVALIKTGIKVKSARNVIDANFRAMYRDARAEVEALAGKDPFLDLRWPKVRRDPPEPFTPEEQKKILDYFAEREPFYYAFVRFQFDTGARPSESTAITWADLNATARTVRIHKSRHLGVDSDTKTTKSRRSIILTQELTDLLQCLRHPWQKDSDKVFTTKTGTPINAGQWTKDYWQRVLDGLQIPRRKFYATRHSFITSMVKAGANLKAIGDYAGTSAQMIEENYCGELQLDPTIFQRSAANPLKNLASPTGFEPVLSA